MANPMILIKSEVIGSLRRGQEASVKYMDDPWRYEDREKMVTLLANQKVIMDALLLLLDGQN